jgi:phosphate-selective porin
MTEDTFFGAVYVNGNRRRWEGDLDWRSGSAAVRAEYTHVTDDRIGQGLSGEDLPDVRYRSYYVSGTWVVTGERKARPLAPRRPFLQGGLGALEIAARFEHLWCDSVGGADAPFRNPRAEHILGSGDRVVTVGANWILNRWLALQLNAIREAIDDPERSPVAGGRAFWSRVVRLRLGL